MQPCISYQNCISSYLKRKFKKNPHNLNTFNLIKIQKIQEIYKTVKRISSVQYSDMKTRASAFHNHKLNSDFYLEFPKPRG